MPPLRTPGAEHLAASPYCPDMAAPGAWQRHSGRIVCETEHIRLHRDRVTGPGRERGDYDWVETADQVRVAATSTVDGRLLFIDQDHYLVGRMLQLPGGSVDPGENNREAAARELDHETGLHGGAWTYHGAVHGLPGLSPARIHLWSARDLRQGPTCLEANEADITVVRLLPAEAAAAVRNGRITCAASVALVLATMPST
jgi:8-oxo-dGTP pyrophosphatase MutT (NUDIX family)